ncbi:hemolysin III family protein [Methylopila sp. M107]|uniref:PAQR family membrane homeostasis protein TrhA n=1 Tax=Methylopila sp. M107 TaxID=1101190 RepID=UPI0003788DB8|nr:hemolysin III family protein [Methylopila sp. M107]
MNAVSSSERKRTVGEIAWAYSTAELWADGIVHAIGLLLVATGSIALMIAVRDAAGATVAGVYLCSLTFSFVASAAYNIWPVSRLKWLLRRFDQSAIYLLIAGTYTPFLASVEMWGALASVWAVAFVGVALRIWRPGDFDRLSIALYLLLGWSGVLLLGELLPIFPGSTLALIGAGGGLYSLGVIFHVWRRLHFQNAIWHAFVLAAACIHYAAVWSTLV